MKQNIGATDRVIRFLAGLLLLAVGLLVLNNHMAQWILVLLGAVALIEGIIGYCWLYQLLGINTNQKDKRKLWKVISWVFILCGLVAYGIGWTALMNNTTYCTETIYWFYDAMVAGIFGIFFLKYAR